MAEYSHLHFLLSMMCSVSKEHPLKANGQHVARASGTAGSARKSRESGSNRSDASTKRKSGGVPILSSVQSQGAIKLGNLAKSNRALFESGLNAAAPGVEEADDDLVISVGEEKYIRFSATWDRKNQGCDMPSFVLTMGIFLSLYTVILSTLAAQNLQYSKRTMIEPLIIFISILTTVLLDKVGHLGVRYGNPEAEIEYVLAVLLVLSYVSMLVSVGSVFLLLYLNQKVLEDETSSVRHAVWTAFAIEWLNKSIFGSTLVSFITIGFYSIADGHEYVSVIGSAPSYVKVGAVVAIALALTAFVAVVFVVILLITWRKSKTGLPQNPLFAELHDPKIAIEAIVGTVVMIDLLTKTPELRTKYSEGIKLAGTDLAANEESFKILYGYHCNKKKFTFKGYARCFVTIQYPNIGLAVQDIEAQNVSTQPL